MQDERHKIVVWLPSPMGDAILCTPALRALREHFKSCEITFVANSVVRRVLSPSGFNDDWLEYAKENPFAIARKLKKNAFSYAILFKNSFASALTVTLARIPVRVGYAREMRGFLLTEKLHPERLKSRKFKPLSMVDYYLKIATALGAPVAGRELELSVDPQDERTVHEKIPEIAQAVGPIIVLVPGAAFGPSKLWPAPRFAQTADKLIEDFDATVIISVASTPTETQISKEICASSRYSSKGKEKQPAGRLISLADRHISLGELKPLLSMADLVITNDTGPRHIATALQRKVITIFGPSDPAWTETGYANEIKIISSVDCAPCHKKICPREHECMTAITVEEVLAAAVKLLKR